jgi:IgA Peptidase M64/Peptidase M64 N-terminus
MEVPLKRKRSLVILFFWALPALAVWAPAQVAFDDYFLDQALRLDLYQTGDAKQETLTVHQIYQEGIWPESKSGLIPPFDYGRYVFQLYDIASNRLIFSRGFDTMFAEYKTTSPALSGVERVFERSLRIPLPKRPVLFVVERRDKRHLLQPIFDQVIDPEDYHIIRETPAAGDEVIELQLTGDPHNRVDFVFLAEGYTAGEKDKFKSDLERMTQYLFSVEPYKSLKDRFNIRGVFRPSPEEAMDEPRQRSYKKTVLNASFNAFDLDRYMLIEEDHRMHEIAGQVPYDAIVVLVNSKRYGGGSIGLDYCVTTVDHPMSPQVFVHELGHSFAYLADEYYQSEVSYNDFYPKGVEPLEPNITALLDPAHVKWQDLLAPGIGIPTEYGKEAIEALQAERQKNRQALDKEIEDAKKKDASAKDIQRIRQKFEKAEAGLNSRIENMRKKYADLEDKVGVFEGAGYASKGLYRPMIYCIMISSPKGEFCRVCQRAIARMIDFYSPPD